MSDYMDTREASSGTFTNGADLSIPANGGYSNKGGKAPTKTPKLGQRNVNGSPVKPWGR